MIQLSLFSGNNVWGRPLWDSEGECCLCTNEQSPGVPLKAEDDFYRSISEEESLCSLVSEETLVSFNHGREICSQTCPQDKFMALESLNIPKLGDRAVQFSCSVVSNSLRPHESQHARPPCPSPTPGVFSNSCPSSQGCHPAISSSIIPFSFCPQISPSIRVFSSESTLRMRWPKYWSFSFSISPSNEHPGLISFRMVWLGTGQGMGKLGAWDEHTHYCV